MTEEQTKSNPLAIAIGVCVAGVVTLLAGIIFLAVTLARTPTVSDAEYLVEVGEWRREDEPGVIWNFAEIGKGTLTTDSHVNDYDFIWSIDGDKLQLETEWIYQMNDSFDYVVKDGNLVLNDTIVLVPAEE